MYLPFIEPLARRIKSAALLLIFCAATSCQTGASDETTQTDAVASEPEVTATVATEKRPAPEFFAIPEEMLKKRVWICEDEQSDIFHVKHDCPILVQCKGKGTFRNLLLPRAIEDYGRYNCQECSEDLDFIFDQDAVRELGK